MKRLFDRILGSQYVQTGDDLSFQRARLLIIVILTIGVADLITLGKDVIFGTITQTYLLMELAVLVILLVLYWYTRRGKRWPTYIFLVFLTLVATYTYIDNPSGSVALALATPVVVTPLVAAPWLCIPVAALTSIMLYILSFALHQPIGSPLGIVILGVLGALSWLSSWSLENAFREAQSNAHALTETNKELQTGRALLESYTRELEQRSKYLQASAEVGHATTSILETDVLIEQSVELIRERFGLYYVGLFLIDDTGDWAVLRAGTGQAGQIMMARGHRIKIGQGMIGWSIAHVEARSALDAGQDAVRLATPELPDTHSEAAIPLRSRDQVIGALTVQSIQPGAFDQETMVVLQTMADQLAVALDNARLFTEHQAALEAERRAYGELSREAWRKLADTHQTVGFLRNKRGIFRVSSRRYIQMETTPDENSSTTLAMPIKIRGQVIGMIDARKDETSKWTDEDVQLMKALAEQLSMALDGARLYQDTQRRAEQERLMSEVAGRVRETLDLETVLKTAAQEIRQALGLPEVVVRLAPTVPGAAKDSVERSNK